MVMMPELKRISVFLLVLTTVVCCARAQSATGNTTSELVGSSAADGTENVTVSTQKTKPEQSWLIATSGDVLDGSTAITFEVVKPSSLSQWPDMLRLSVLHDDKTDEISLTADQQKASDDAVRRRYFGSMPKETTGLVRVALVDFKSNQLALLLTQPGVTQWTYVESTAATEDGEVENVLAVDEPALSINEPMYFVVGGSTDSVDTRDATARFQLSFNTGYLMQIACRSSGCRYSLIFILVTRSLHSGIWVPTRLLLMIPVTVPIFSGRVTPVIKACYLNCCERVMSMNQMARMARNHADSTSFLCNPSGALSLAINAR